MTIPEAANQIPNISGLLRRSIFWEAAIGFALVTLYIWVISLGDENGFGFFHQPQNSMVVPLAVGALINAGLFCVHAFYAIPTFLASGQWHRYIAVIFGFGVASIVFQVVTQKLIIIFLEPELSGLSWAALTLENTFMPPFILIFSALYKFARDWAIHQREAKSYQLEKSALKEALREARDEMRILSSAGRPENFLQINVGSEKLQIPMGAIQYIKSASNYAEIVTPENSYLAYGALKDLIKKLPAARFARIHRSYVVGMEHIRLIKGDVIQLSNIELPIGSVYKYEFLEKWKDRAGAPVDAAPV